MSLSELAETPEERAYIEQQLRAYEQAATDTAKQKATLEQLTQQAAAWLVGVSTKHLRDQQAARNRDGTYNAPDLVQWIIDRTLGQAKKQWERDSDNLKSATERQAEARAEKLEEEAKGLKDTYVEREVVELEFMEMAAAVRSELEALPKLMANDFPADLRDSLTRELKGQVKQILRRLRNKGQKFEPTG